MDTLAFRAAIERTALVRNTDARIVTKEGESSYAPWIFDFRALTLTPEWLDTYAEIFWERHAHLYPFQVGGMESGSIALVAAIVMKGVERGTPVNGFYMRKSRKRDGLMKRVEGSLDNTPVILVDDLIHSGQTFEKQVLVLGEEGAKVRKIFVILAYSSPESYEFFKVRDIPVESLYMLKDFGLSLQQHKSLVGSMETEWVFRGGTPAHQYVVAKSAPLFHEGFVYVGSDDGVFRALDAYSGLEMWRFDMDAHPEGKGIFSSPIVDGGSVYFGAYDGNVYALDARTGKKKWQYSEADWVGSSPAVSDAHGLLYVGLEFGLIGKKGGIAALSLEDGSQVWRQSMPEYTHGSPLYIEHEEIVIVGGNDGVLRAFDAANGALKWSYETCGQIKSAPVYDAQLNRVFLTSMDGNLYAVDATDGTLRGTFAAGAGIYSSPVVHENTVFIASLDKCVYALDASTLRKKWERQTRGRIFATPAVYENVLWIGSNDGRFYGLSLEDGSVVASHQLSDRIVNRASFDPASGRYFVSTCANELYCLRRT